MPADSLLIEYRYMREMDIIMLSYAANPDLKNITEQAVVSLHASEDAEKIRFNIVVLESARDMEGFRYNGTTTIYPRTPFGYHRYMNIGIEKTQSPFVCICNNDLYFHKGWASAMLDAFDKNPDLASVSPFCSVHHTREGYLPDSGLFYGYTIRQEVAGWCLVFKREILKTTGRLDPNFKFWFADNDYANTLQKHGFRHALVTSSIVDHLESRTLRSRSEEEQLKLTSGERFYFEYKWEGRGYFSYLNRLRKFRMNLWKERFKSQKATR